MILKYTPPVSPREEIDEDEIFELNENDVAEVISVSDEDAPGSVESNGAGMEEEEEEENSENFTPLREDAKFVLRKHDGIVLCCSLHPKQANIAVTGALDDVAHVWDINNSNILLTCNGHEDSVEKVSFSCDGSYLASGDLTGIIKVWKMSDFSLLSTFELGDELGWLEWHHGANVLIAASTVGTIQMFKIPQGECKLILPSHGKQCEIGKTLPDGKRLVAGFADGSLKIIDMKLGTVLFDIKQTNDDSINCLDVHKDNNLVIAGTIGGQVFIVKSQTGKIASVLHGLHSSENKDTIESVAFCRDPLFPFAASSSLNGVLVIWDITKQTQRHKHIFDSGVIKIIWAPDKPLLYTCHLEGVVKLYDARSGNIVREFMGHTNHCLDMDLSLDGSLLITSAEDKTARVYETNDNPD